MTTSRCPRSRSTRRDPLPHALRFVRHRPWFFRLGALRLLHGLVVILGRLSKCYFFLLVFPSAVCGVGALGVTPSPTPCGLSATGPGSSVSAPSAFCRSSWSSSVGYPSVISSCLSSPLLFVVLVRSG